MKKAVSFSSYAFGCRVTHAEREYLDREIVRVGAFRDDGNPHFHIIHTCVVTKKAERQVRQYIYQIRKKFPQTKIIAVGCGATLWKKLRLSFDGFEIVPHAEKDRIIDIISKAASAPAGNRGSNKSDQIRPDDGFTASGRAYVKIQDGCGRFCSYCIVPTLRGKPESRTIDELVREIKDYGDTVSEIILTAINTEYFGRENRESLPLLVDRILEETGVPRLSFGSIHPFSLTPEFLDWYRKNAAAKRLVHFFHIPLQSLSDTVLKRMDRGYASGPVLDKITQIASINPQAFLATDIITGFPGETGEEFRETYEKLAVSPVSRFHVFRFSPRPGTKAANFPENTDSDWTATLKKRALRLRRLSDKKYREFSSRLPGYRGPALLLTAKTGKFTPVLLPNQVTAYLKKTDQKAGSVTEVEVTGFFAGKLMVKTGLGTDGGKGGPTGPEISGDDFQTQAETPGEQGEISPVAA